MGSERLGRFTLRFGALCTLLVLCGMGNSAYAQAEDRDQWRTAVTLYSYFPSIYGDNSSPR